MAKCSKIRDIVWLRKTLRRWRSRAAARVAEGGAVPVPAGHVAVCVGVASRRFVVRAAHLNHPVFLELLRQAEEEYGFRTGACGPIALPCDEDRFRDVLRRVSSGKRRGRSFGCRAPAASSREVATPPFCSGRRRRSSCGDGSLEATGITHSAYVLCSWLAVVT